MHRPALGKVPALTVDTLTIKATATGITYLHDRKFKNRYAGSKQCAVDINGNLWLSAADLAKDVQAWKTVKGKKVNVSELPGWEYKGGKWVEKETAASPGCRKMLRDTNVIVEPAISTQFPVCQNISEKIAGSGEKIAKKERKKSYSVNKKEVRGRIMGYLNTRKGRKEMYFVTVSFPEGTPDDTCYQAFNTWLTALRQKRKDPKTGKLRPAMLKEYLWIAQRQLGERAPTGKRPTLTIHFHIAIPHFINIQRANALMRGTLKTYAKKGMMPGAVVHAKTKEIGYLACIARYNGVDLAKNKYTRRVVNFALDRGGKALASYLARYVTRNDAGIADKDGNIEVPGFSHLAWHNSRGFSCLFTAVTFTVNEFYRNGFRSQLNAGKQYNMLFATFIPWMNGPPPILLQHLYELNSYIQQLQDEQSTASLYTS